MPTQNKLKNAHRCTSMYTNTFRNTFPKPTFKKIGIQTQNIAQIGAANHD